MTDWATSVTSRNYPSPRNVQPHSHSRAARGRGTRRQRRARSARSVGQESSPVLGNSRELDRAYKEHFAFVWRSLRCLGLPLDALDDAAQDVFMVALRRHSEFRGRSSYRTWLFGIAANVAREERRKGRRAEVLEPIDDALPSSQSSPLEQATDAEAMRFVEAFLSTLDDAKREVFILAELEQMPVTEIADAVGAQSSTPSTRGCARLERPSRSCSRRSLWVRRDRLLRGGERSPAAERLLARARRGAEPSAIDEARVRSRLHARVLAQRRCCSSARGARMRSRNR